jgi:hypothetical protein
MKRRTKKFSAKKALSISLTVICTSCISSEGIRVNEPDARIERCAEPETRFKSERQAIAMVMDRMGVAAENGSAPGLLREMGDAFMHVAHEGESEELSLMLDSIMRNWPGMRIDMEKRGIDPEAYLQNMNIPNDNSSFEIETSRLVLLMANGNIGIPDFFSQNWNSSADELGRSVGRWVQNPDSRKVIQDFQESLGESAIEFNRTRPIIRL